MAESRNMDPDAEEFWSLIGLTPSQRRSYERLLGRAPGPGEDDGGDATEIARLVELGLVRRRGRGHEILDPALALASAARRRQLVLDLAGPISEQLHVDFAARRVQSDPRTLFEIVRGRSELASRASALMAGARQELRAICTPPFVVGPDPELTAEQVTMMDRGVTVMSLYDASVLNTPEGLAHLQAITAAGEVARVLPRITTKMWVVDGTVAMLPLVVTPRGGPPDSVVVSHSAITDALLTLFNHLWCLATPVRLDDDKPGERRTELARERTMLRLMATGVGDAGLARHFAVSERTVRRWVAECLDRHHVTSRFQLGLLARDQNLL